MSLRAAEGRLRIRSLALSRGSSDNARAGGPGKARASLIPPHAPWRSTQPRRIWSPFGNVPVWGIPPPQDGLGPPEVSGLGPRRSSPPPATTGKPCPLHPPGGAQQAISRWAPLLGSRPSRHPVPVEISDPTPSSQMVREEAARQMWMAPPRTSEVRGAPWSAAHLLSQPGSAPYRVQMSGGCAPTLEANTWPRAAVIWQQR